MYPPAPSGDDQRPEPAPEVLVIPPRRSLARTSGSVALDAARRAVRSLVRREPGSMLTIGFGAGLLARAAIAGLVAARSSQTGRRSLPPPFGRSPVPPEILETEVRAIVIRTTRLLRRPPGR